MNERKCSLCDLVGTWIRHRIWNWAAHRGWTNLREWNQRTCKHPRWNDRVWGDVHCASCGNAMRDERVDAIFSPIVNAMNRAEAAYNEHPMFEAGSRTPIPWHETSIAFRDAAYAREMNNA